MSCHMLPIQLSCSFDSQWRLWSEWRISLRIVHVKKYMGKNMFKENEETLIQYHLKQNPLRWVTTVGSKCMCGAEKGLWSNLESLWKCKAFEGYTNLLYYLSEGILWKIFEPIMLLNQLWQRWIALALVDLTIVYFVTFVKNGSWMFWLALPTTEQLA